MVYRKSGLPVGRRGFNPRKVHTYPFAPSDLGTFLRKGPLEIELYVVELAE